MIAFLKKKLKTNKKKLASRDGQDALPQFIFHVNLIKNKLKEEKISKKFYIMPNMVTQIASWREQS